MSLEPRTTTYPRTHESAVEIAGLLAEAGVQELRITSPDGSTRELRTRVTDLPSVLANTIPGAKIEMVGYTIRVAEKIFFVRKLDCGNDGS